MIFDRLKGCHTLLSLTSESDNIELALEVRQINFVPISGQTTLFNLLKVSRSCWLIILERQRKCRKLEKPTFSSINNFFTKHEFNSCLRKIDSYPCRNIFPSQMSRSGLWFQLQKLRNSLHSGALQSLSNISYIAHKVHLQANWK